MRFGVEVLAANLYECVLHSIYRTGAMSSNYLSCYPLIVGRKTLRLRTNSNFTDLHIITLPRIPVEVDTEERGYTNASHHGGSSCSVTGSDGIFVSPDESRGYLGFSTVTPPQRFPFGRDNLKNNLLRTFKFGMWVYMGNATNAIVL